MNDSKLTLVLATEDIESNSRRMKVSR
jgi:hypothetical protein